MEWLKNYLMIENFFYFYKMLYLILFIDFLKIYVYIFFIKIYNNIIKR